MGRISVDNTRSTFSITQIDPDDWDSQSERSKTDLELNEKLNIIKHEITLTYHKKSSEGKVITASDLKSELKEYLQLKGKKFKKQIRAKNHPISEEKYREAFRKLFNCDENDLEIQQYYPNGPYLVKYKESVYRIDGLYDIQKYAEELLSSEETAIFIPVEFWADIAECVHMEPQFLVDLAQRLESDQELLFFNTVLNMCQTSNNSPYTFWHGLEAVDYTGQIYPKAVYAATKHFNMGTLIDELSADFIDSGDTYLNELQNGIFEYVDIDEESLMKYDEDLSEEDIHTVFYIYTVGDNHWA